MSEDFEDRLRDALRPVDPGEDFAQRVILRVKSEPPRSARVQILRRRWVPAALAASVVLGLLVSYGWRVERERSGLEARRQLMEALQLTGEKLDLAYQVINRQSDSKAGDNSGA